MRLSCELHTNSTLLIDKLRSIQINSRQDLLKNILRIQIVERAIEKTGREVWKVLMENDLENVKHLEVTYTLDIGYKN